MTFDKAIFVAILLTVGVSRAGNLGWPENSSGVANLYIERTLIGSCQGELKIKINEDASLGEVNGNFHHCSTTNRVHFVFSMALGGSGWDWENGLGTFQGKPAGWITTEEIHLLPWAHHQFRAIKMGPDKIYYQFQLEHDNRNRIFEGVFHVSKP